MKSSLAKQLIESSDRCTIITDEHGVEIHQERSIPLVEELLCGEWLGTHTAMLDRQELRFDARKLMEHCALENPEYIARKYRRHSFVVDIFLGDAYGYAILLGGSDHAALMRAAITCRYTDRKGDVIDDAGQYLPADIVIIGKPKRLSVQYSGVILGKQDNVDATYISCWEPNDNLAPVIQFARLKYDGPYKLELPSPDTGAFSITDLK
jgi:hypothetical protein